MSDGYYIQIVQNCSARIKQGRNEFDGNYLMAIHILYIHILTKQWQYTLEMAFVHYNIIKIQIGLFTLNWYVGLAECRLMMMWLWVQCLQARRKKSRRIALRIDRQQNKIVIVTIIALILCAVCFWWIGCANSSDTHESSDDAEWEKRSIWVWNMDDWILTMFLACEADDDECNVVNWRT